MTRIETKYAVYMITLHDQQRKIFNVVRKSKRTLKERKTRVFEYMVLYWVKKSISIKYDLTNPKRLY